ncbi:MAG: copper chaperone PCu(A)C [Caldilineales bacterium]|nr:copper chaperone PCu(A)C [Caldilineales bacterium]MDW8316989.1 copper chaperone PCu(A)C [Anaerolineae bacterium]
MWKSPRPVFVLLTILLVVFALAGCGPAGSGSASISAENVWARAAKMSGEAMGGMQHGHGAESMEYGGTKANSAVYMKLVNRGAQADRLISAKADVCQTVELHETVMQGDVMRMQQVQGGIEVPANGSVELKPGGLHVMLIGLTKDLNPGDKFPVTLQFEKAGAITVQAEVRQP